MIIKTGLAENYILFVVDVFEDDFDNIISSTRFEKFEDFYRYITEENFENVDGLNCCLTIYYGDGIQMIPAFENSYSFKNGKIDLSRLFITLNSFVEVIEECGGVDIGLFKSESVINQGLFELKHTDDYKKLQKIRLDLNDRKRVCSRCFDSLEKCTCKDPDKGVLIIDKDFQPFLKTLGNTCYDDEETEFLQQWRFEYTDVKVERHGDKIRGDFTISFRCQTYPELPGFETFPVSDAIENDEDGRFDIHCEGKTEAEYEKDKAAKFKIFNDWAKEFKEKREVDPFSLEENKDKKKVYDLDKYVYVCPHCFAERSQCVCDDSKNAIEIDRNIYPVIRNLNRAGFRTSFCCEGHRKEDPSGNIKFAHFYHFDSIPDFCKYTNDCFLNFYYEGDTDEEFEADKKRKLAELLNWSESFLK